MDEPLYNVADETIGVKMSDPIYCKHDITDIDAAVDVDGLCPLCQSDRLIEQRMEINDLRAQRDELLEALSSLVRRLDNIWVKSNLASVFLIADQHGIQYTGETWVEPLDKARAAISKATGTAGERP